MRIPLYISLICFGALSWLSCRPEQVYEAKPSSGAEAAVIVHNPDPLIDGPVEAPGPGALPVGAGIAITLAPSPIFPVFIPRMTNSSGSWDDSQEECFEDSDCDDDDPCTENLCADSECTDFHLPGCISCTHNSECPLDTICIKNVCTKPGSFTLSGTISGLTASGLILQNNGADNLSLSSGATQFAFDTLIPVGGSYNVTVLQQPTGLICTVDNGSGTNVNNNINNITVLCSPISFTIGGTISDLTANGLILQNNGADNLSINSGATEFSFATPVTEGGSYHVTIFQQPTGLTCTVGNASGTNVNTEITNITVICSPIVFSIGGTISDLTASGLILQNNGADNLSINSGATEFTFATPVAQGGSYDVSVFQQPTGLTCTVINGSGTNVMANVTNVSITCAVSLYTIGGDVSGLIIIGADSLTLQNNGTDDLIVTSNGAFAFATQVPFGGTYNVSVSDQPNGQTCVVSNGSGTVTQNVTDVVVTCTPDDFTIGGNVSGLTGSGLVLRNNGADNLAINSDGFFTFMTPVPYGGSYNVSVFTQPSGQFCSVTAGSGGPVTMDVNTVVVTCVQARIVFASSGSYNGNLGGLIGADALCNALAAAATTPLTGTFKAWLSDSVSSPSTSFTQTAMFVLVNGTAIANNWADLIDGSLLSPINRDESGNFVLSSLGSWTGTNTNGTASAARCNNWTEPLALTGSGGLFVADSRWTAAGSSKCGTLRHIYCFQQ